MELYLHSHPHVIAVRSTVLRASTDFTTLAVCEVEQHDDRQMKGIKKETFVPN